MRLEHREPCAEPVLGPLQDLTTWPSWMTGLGRVEAHTDTDVELFFGGPRPLRARVDVTRTDDGIRVLLLEGDPSHLDGQVQLREGELFWQVELHFPITVPGPLLRELEREILPDWSRSLRKYSEADG